MIKKEILPLVIFAILVLWLTGSGITSLLSQPEPTAALAIITDTPSPTATATSTSTPIATSLPPTHTPTSVPTQTQAPTQTPTPQPIPTLEIKTTTAPTTAAPLEDSGTIIPTLSPTPSPSPSPEVRATIQGQTETIIFVKSDTIRQGHILWCIQRDSDGEEMLFHKFAAAPAWSPNGGRVAFFGEEGISQLGPPYVTGIWLVDYVEPCQAQNPRLLVETNYVQNIAWSPDETKIAFEISKNPDIEDSEVLVVDTGDGGPVVDPDSDERIPVGIAGKHPAWSPDGQKLVVNTCVDSACGLWQFNFLGELEQQLTFDDTDSYPNWFQVDGSEYIVFVRQISPSQWDIYLLELGDEVPEPLTSRDDVDTAPVFSPNSEDIYIYTNHQGGGEHWRIEAIGLDGQVHSSNLPTGIGESKLHGLVRPAIR